MNRRATFLIIERPLDPSPPKESRPHWCFQNTLVFYDEENQNIWEQEIPEAKISWIETPREDSDHDEFSRYGRCKVFYEENLGWQLRWTITHKHAKQQRDMILKYLEDHHNNHFIDKEIRGIMEDPNSCPPSMPVIVKVQENSDEEETIEIRNGEDPGEVLTTGTDLKDVIIQPSALEKRDYRTKIQEADDNEDYIELRSIADQMCDKINELRMIMKEGDKGLIDEIDLRMKIQRECEEAKQKLSRLEKWMMDNNIIADFMEKKNTEDKKGPFTI